MLDPGPLSLVGLEGLTVLRQGSFERVRFTGEVTLSFVVDGSGETSGRLDSVGVGELDVRRAPDNTLNSELGWD